MNEGLPLTVLEAKRCGVPTITFSWGDSTFEVVNDKGDGYIVKTDEEFIEKIIYLIDNQNELKKLSVNAQSSYYNFSPDSFKENYTEFIEKY